MDWKQYEAEIEAYFRQEYPLAHIKANVKLPGKLSKTERQVDLLIEGEIVDFQFRLVIDAKYRNKKLDVNDVEQFSGLVRDVSARKGILISTEGYTEAAIQRAHADELILEVLNFKELKNNHGSVGFPFAGPCGAIVPAPLGWVVDGTQGRGALAWLYQRGLTYEVTTSAREFMYVNFWRKKEELVSDLDSLLKHQEDYLREGPNPISQIEIIDGVKRTGARSVIRIARFSNHPGLVEYTGFLDFDDFIFMCVLFTSEQLAEKNLGKLRFVLRKVIKLKVRHEPDRIIFDDTP